MAIHEGFEVYSNVNWWFFKVEEVLFFKFSNVYSLVEFSRTQIGILSVSSILLVKTGSIFSSPSEKFPDLAKILY